jgi:hypothetical protein
MYHNYTAVRFHPGCRRDVIRFVLPISIVPVDTLVDVSRINDTSATKLNTLQYLSLHSQCLTALRYFLFKIWSILFLALTHWTSVKLTMPSIEVSLWSLRFA